METKSTSKQRWVAGGIAGLALMIAAACGDEPTQVSSGAASPSAKPASAVVASADAIDNRAKYGPGEWTAPAGAVYADTLENRADQLELKSKSVSDVGFRQASAAEAERYVEGIESRTAPVSSSYSSTLEDRAAQLELRDHTSTVTPSADSIDRRAQIMEASGEDHSKHWHR